VAAIGAGRKSFARSAVSDYRAGLEQIEQQPRGAMIRVFVALLSACLWTTAAWTQSVPSASPVCFYESKSYSDGALICAYRSVMLTCSLDGPRATWKPVTDSKLASVCETPTVRPRVVEAPPAQPRVVEVPPRRRHRHGVRHAVRRNADRSARCFVFNGKQYCE